MELPPPYEAQTGPSTSASGNTYVAVPADAGKYTSLKNVFWTDHV